MKLKTKAWPDGRDWPDELTLDVGSNMPMDVYAIHPQHFGVLYVRHDIATKREQKARLDALREAAEIADSLPRGAHSEEQWIVIDEARDAILARIKEVEG